MPSFFRSISQRRGSSRGNGAGPEKGGSSGSHFGLSLPDPLGGDEKAGPSYSLHDTTGMKSQSPSNGNEQISIYVPHSDKRPMTPPSSPPNTHTSHRAMSRSPVSSQALPYHRPWNKNLTSSVSEPDYWSTTLQQSEQRSPIKSAAMAPSSTYTSGMPDFNFNTLPDSKVTSPIASYASHPGAILDFRVSTMTLNNKTSPAARKQVLDAGRKVSRKKAKAPTDLNIMVVGGKMTGKTSWIRTFLSTIDLSQCNEETRIAASHFGISASSNHITRATDPVTPLSTKSINCLGGMDLSPNSLLPLAALEQGNSSLVSTRMQSRGRPMSTASERTSAFSFGVGNEPGKLRFSICDTPGIDFEVEDDFEIDRSATKLVKYVEEKMSKTLSEEGKVQRRARPEDHIHLILYFVDPRHLVERTASRKRDVLEARHGKKDPTKGRSNSESLSSGRNDFQNGHMKRSESNPQSLQEAGSQDDFEYGVEGLSSVEVNVISRLSRLANVLPIIAKADTLTETRLHEVRAAIRYSLKEAKVDLGVFDIQDGRKKKPAMRANIDDIGAFDMDDDKEEVVKVIKTRRGRTFSTAGSKAHGDGDFASTVGHGLDSEDSHVTGAPTTTSSNGDEDELTMPKEDLLPMIPLSIFVPDPVRTDLRMQKSSQYGGGRSRWNGDHDDYGHIPPVPPLPRGMSESSGFGGMLEQYVSDRQQQQQQQQYQQQRHGNHHYNQYSPPPMPMTLSDSGRYRREFRWGSANVLDPRQCDFGLLRNAILGSQLDELRESTALRYENFRSKRLELNRMLRETQTRLEKEQQ